MEMMFLDVCYYVGMFAFIFTGWNAYSIFYRLIRTGNTVGILFMLLFL